MGVYVVCGWVSKWKLASQSCMIANSTVFCSFFTLPCRGHHSICLHLFSASSSLTPPICMSSFTTPIKGKKRGLISTVAVHTFCSFILHFDSSAVSADFFSLPIQRARFTFRDTSHCWEVSCQMIHLCGAPTSAAVSAQHLNELEVVQDLHLYESET